MCILVLVIVLVIHLLEAVGMVFNVTNNTRIFF